MSTVTLNLGGETMGLTSADMAALANLQETRGWELLKEILHAINRGTRIELESAETPLDRMRGLQGRLSVANDLVDLLDQGVVRWVEAKRKDDS